MGHPRARQWNRCVSVSRQKPATAVELHRARRHRPRGLGRATQNAARSSGSLARHAACHTASARAFDRGGVVGEAVTDGLERADRTPNCSRRDHVLDRELQRARREPDELAPR
jgi:hypothetical protein